MMRPSNTKTQRAIRIRRKQQVEQCLTAHGLRGDRKRVSLRDQNASHAHCPTDRLRFALESLGPVFSGFGRYLGSRIDLLPTRDCLDLLAISDQAQATPPEAVRSMLVQAFDTDIHNVYATFEDVPFESRTTFQLHRAWLVTGQAVVVKVIHPEVRDQSELDLDLLPVLTKALLRTYGAAFPAAQVIVDFRRTWHQHIHLQHEVEAFRTLRQEMQDFDLLRIPYIYTMFCNTQVATYEALPGLNLEQILTLNALGDSGDPAPRHRIERAMGLKLPELAHRLCLLWLRQALLGSRTPSAWHPGHVVILPNKQIALTSGLFVSLSEESKSNLWQYLLATSTDTPDNAHAHLLQEMHAPDHAIKVDELRHRFREIVPFRDSDQSTDISSYGLADHLFVQWKLASANGFRPTPHLLGFYQGLFHTMVYARQCDPHHDLLQNAFNDVRTLAMFNQFQDMMSMDYMSESLNKYMTLMMAFPQQLDEALTDTANHGTNGNVSDMRRGRPSTAQSRLILIIALVLTLASGILLSSHFVSIYESTKWVEYINFIMILALGAFVIRMSCQK